MINKIKEQDTSKNLNVYGKRLNFSDKLDLIKKVLQIYAIITDINVKNKFLRPKLIDVLSFYILWGYNIETKDLVLKSLKISEENLNQINYELTKKGFLVRDIYNLRVKNLSEETKKLSNYFLSNELNKIFLIKFDKNK